MMRRNYCLAWAFFLFASITSAQEFRATLTGRVTDPQDLAVVDATVQARNISTNEVSSGKTDTQRVAELPLNSRNPFMLGAMMSGVTFRGSAIWQRPFDNGAIAEWSINGSRQRQNEFLMDGAPNNGQAGDNNVAYVPIVDAVQEFKMQSNT